MRIAQVYPSYHHRGGIERVVAELSAGLASAHHEVEVICSNSSLSPPEGVKCLRVPAAARPESLRLLTFALSGTLRSKTGRYHIVHGHGATLGADVLTMHSCHRAGLEVLGQKRRGPMPIRRNYGIADNVRLFVERQNLRRGRCARVIAVSQGIKKELQEFYGVPPADIVVIHNGVDTHAFQPVVHRDQKEILRRAYGLEDVGFVVLFIANEFERKGLIHVIDALSLIRDSMIHVVVAGADDAAPYRQLVRTRRREHQILFLGPVDHVVPLYQLSDLFVLPSLYEPSGLVLLEAAACGVPVLAPAVHGAVDFLVNGETGCIIETEPESVAEAIQRVREDPLLLRRFSVAARKLACTFSWDRNVKATLRVYQELLEER